jgi:PAS domain S-box-containing protein
MFQWQANPYALPSLLSGVVSAIVAWSAWKRRRVSGAASFALLMLSVAIWSLGTALQLLSATLPAGLFWIRLEYVGVVSVPVMWLIFCLQYTGRARWLTTGRTIALWAIPCVVLALVWTAPLHKLYYREVRLVAGGPYVFLETQRGVGYWVGIAYDYLLLAIGAVLLAQLLASSSPPYRRQLAIVLVALVIPWAGSVLYMLGWVSPYVDPAPMSLALAGLAIAWGLLRFRLLDVVPVARSVLVDTMEDAWFVLDEAGRLIDLNPAARAILGRDWQEIIGQPIAQLFPERQDLVRRFREVAHARAEISVGEGDARRSYDMRLSTLHDPEGRRTGRLVVLRDVTEHKRLAAERERLIEELQETLDRVRTLSGLLPICARCKKIRDDRGYWHSVEVFVRDHSKADFSHGICPDCLRELDPELAAEILDEGEQDPASGREVPYANP